MNIDNQQPLNILLVENNDEDARRIVEAIENGDTQCTVTHLTKPRKAIPLLKEDLTRYQLVVTEHVLPGMTGLELFIELRENDIKIPLVLLTGAGSEHLASMALRAGVNDYIIKDPDYEYLELLTFALPLVVHRFKEKQARRKAEIDREYRLEFERLISTLSTNFINLPANQVDEGIQEALGAVARLAEASRSYVFIADNSTKEAILKRKYIWRAEGLKEMEAFDLQLSKRSTNSWWVDKLKNLDALCITSLEDLPPNSEDVKKLMNKYSIKSVLIMPMSKNGRLIGFVGFDTIEKEMEWSQSVTAVLRILAEMFVNALERKRIELRLRDSEEQYRLLVENQAEGIAVLHLDDYTLNLCNHAAEEIFGVGKGKLDGRILRDFADKSSWQAVQKFMEARITGEKGVFDLPIYNDSGERRLIQLSTRSILKEKSTQREAFCIFRDITEQRDLEEQLRQSQKMEAVGEIADGMAREFNNLCTNISTQLREMHGLVKPGSKIHAGLEKIDQITEKGVVLLTQVFSFSGRQQEEFTPLHLGTTLQNLSNMMKRLLGKKFEVVVKFTDDLWQVYCDPGRVEQAIINIVLNARDAMPKGGKLSLEVRNARIGVGTVGIPPGLKFGDYVLVTISDSGVGMTDEVATKLFDPYFSTKSNADSSGMGLTVAYINVRHCKGEIRVSSTLGEGSTFKIYMPRFVESEDSSQQKRRKEELPRGSESVLVVDDEEEVRLLTESMLENLGYNVRSAENGEAALKLLKRLKQPVDLLVTDILMPEMDGISLAVQARIESPKLRVLLISGYPELAPTDQINEHDGYAFLSKPFTAIEFAKKVRSAIEGK